MDMGYDNPYGQTGGGFMASSQGLTSPSGAKDYDKDSLRPVTIKQILDAQPAGAEGEFTIDGREISQITFIGQIRNISTQTTYILYKLDDGTGTVEVKQWVDSDAPVDTKPKAAENQYARVWGRLKSFANRRHVGAHHVRAIQDYNEISYHLLEATYVHLYFTRGPLEEASKGSADGAQNQQQSGFGGSSMDMGANGELRGLTPTARKVHQVLKTTPQNNEGLHMQDIASRLGLDTMEVSRAGDELLSSGLIYTTVDDSTWNLLGL